MPDDERRQEYGRREADRILQTVWRELDQLRKSLETLSSALDTRVDQLEEYHIEERAKVQLRVAAETKKMQRLTRISVAFGIIGTGFGMFTAVIHP